MSHEGFQLIDNEALDNSNKRGDFLYFYHQQATNLKDSDQNIESIFGENNNYHQIGNPYFQCELTKEKSVPNAADRILVDGDIFRIINNAFACYFDEARLSTAGGSDIKHIKYVGQPSTIMRVLTTKDGDLLSHFDKIAGTAAQINSTSLKLLLVTNHDIAANKGKFKGHLPLEYIILQFSEL